jgi:putative transposase
MKPQNLDLMRKIDELYTEDPSRGSRSIRRQLRRQGIRVNRKRIQRLMRLMGIKAIYPKPRTTRRHPSHKRYPYLLKDLAITQPNQVWAADITYVFMSRGFMYLVAVMDWYSRKILSWRVSNTLESDFCVQALQKALSRFGRPDIFNTDQGSQFTSFENGLALRGGLAVWIRGYNQVRGHSSLDDRTPDEVYYGLPHPFAQAA